MALDHFASVLLALSAVTTAVASAGLAMALGILAFEFARLVRRRQLVTYEFALPADPPPAAELFFAYVHALLRPARSRVSPSPHVVVAAHGSEAGLRLRVTADEHNVRRLSATLGTVWPGASLVRVPPRTPRCERVEWCPRVEDSSSRESFAGAQPTLARALARAEAGAELWYELGPRELAILFPLASLAPVAAATATQNAMSGERLLGLRMVGNTEQEVRLSLSASRHHLHVLGPTGTGKSTLLLNLVAQDIAAGRGCAVLDPKGDLIRDLLERIPPSRLSQLVYIGPDEGTRP